MRYVTSVERLATAPPAHFSARRLESRMDKRSTGYRAGEGRKQALSGQPLSRTSTGAACRGGRCTRRAARLAAASIARFKTSRCLTLLLTHLIDTSA